MTKNEGPTKTNHFSLANQNEELFVFVVEYVWLHCTQPCVYGFFLELFVLVGEIRSHRFLFSCLASSPMHRNRVEAVEVETQISNRVVSSSKRIDEMQMSLLLAQELSKSEESKRMPSNIVARLMGLDALPNQQTDVNSKISSYEDFTLAADTLQCNEDSIPCEIQSCAQEGECLDVHVMQRKSSKGDKNAAENKMKLVRQKFLEAKCLATDEKLIRSKVFQDALEVLSSNRDLFVKVLDDPNSLFSKHLQEFQTLRPLSQPRRITVLKPARMVESKVDEQVRKHQHPSAEANGLKMNKHNWSSGLVHQRAGSMSQSTRIVVLKRNIENLREIKNRRFALLPRQKCSLEETLV